MSTQIYVSTEHNIKRESKEMQHSKHYSLSKSEYELFVLSTGVQQKWWCIEIKTEIDKKKMNNIEALAVVKLRWDFSKKEEKWRKRKLSVDTS